VTKLTLATTRLASAECGEMPESTTAMPMPSPSTAGTADDPASRPLSGARLIRRRRGIRDLRRTVHARIARQMIDGSVARQLAQLRAVCENDGRAAHPLDYVQPVARGQGIQLSIRAVDDDAACARSSSAPDVWRDQRRGAPAILGWEPSTPAERLRPGQQTTTASQ